jgi:methylmalonyl-CoA mutase
MDDLTLAADFPAADRERWLALVAGILKGAGFDRTLVSRTADGLRVEPLYAKADRPPVGRGRAGRWRVCQRVDHPDPAAANALALADLEGGADALALVLAGAPSARGFGVAVASVDDLDRALAGILPELIALRVETAPFAGRTVAARIAEWAQRRGHDPARLSVEFGLDPVGDIARTGAPPGPWEDLGGRLAETLALLRGQGFAGPAVRVDTRPYHEAGAGEAQELAAALATGVAYLRALEARGHRIEEARDALSFLVVADADEFLTVAKLRALRRLWARIEEACGLPAKPIRLEAETAWRMTTRRDPWVNLLRTTVAAFSAGVGGADGVTVLPFTAALGLADPFARRLARNTQHVLLDEAHLWRVADPAAGAGGFEALTDGLCERAWALFQEIEREGGIVQSLAAGALQGRIAAVRAERDRAIATRRQPITGTSEFPNIAEGTVSTLLPAPAGPEAAPPGALPSLRSSEPFEALRDRAEAILARAGTAPRVFLANLGPVAAFTARASFAKNLFEAGGIQAINNDGFTNLDDLVRSYSESNAKLICVCSSDEIYDQQGKEAVAALRNVSSGPIYVARRPTDSGDELRRAGVTTFIFAGCDTLAVLREALDAASG